MFIAESSLSIMCLAIENFVRNGLDAENNSIDVTMGAPASAAAAGPKMNRVNLFFNRFEPSGFASNGHPGEPWLMRLFCLITAFGEDDISENITGGEFELRMIGEIIRLFHESPVMSNVEINGENVRLQAIFQPLNYESINQLWSTQNDASFRPSVAYEFSLGPIVPLQRKQTDKLVASIGTLINSDTKKEWERDKLTSHVFISRKKTIDVSLNHWQPAICFVENDTCIDAIQLDLNVINLDVQTMTVWLAGDLLTDISFKWLIWNSQNGWLEQDPAILHKPLTKMIDPDGEIPAGLISMPMPFDSSMAETSAQVQLIAQRTYIDPVSNASKTVKSNPLLITFYSN